MQRFQAFNGVFPGFGNLPDRPIRAQQLRKFYLLQIVTDIAPGVTAGVFGDTLEQQREHRERHMGMDAMRCPVKHRA